MNLCRVVVLFYVRVDFANGDSDWRLADSSGAQLPVAQIHTSTVQARLTFFYYTLYRCCAASRMRRHRSAAARIAFRKCSRIIGNRRREMNSAWVNR